MSANHPHLSDHTAQLAQANTAARIDAMRQHPWVGYRRALEVFGKLDALRAHPKVARMPNMLLVGESNNGKTELILEYQRRHPSSIDEERDVVRLPVLRVNQPPGPNERGLYDGILEELFERIRTAESIDTKRSRVIHVLKQIELGLLVIDEIQHLISGPVVKQHNFLNALKHLGNELQVPIVAVGTPTAFHAMQIDKQIQNRFEPVVLERWKLNADLARLLKTLESRIPLRQPSNLPDKALANLVLARTDRTIGEIWSLLRSAAGYAMERGTETIDRDALSNCDYVSPEDRKAAVKAV